MPDAQNFRFAGTVDHIAVKTDDVQRDVEEYKRLGFDVESLHDDWAMVRDAKGFGIALLPPESKHPVHIGMRVDTLEELREAAARENRPLKEHRDRTISFYTRGVGGNVVELIYYPEDFGK